MRSPHLGDAEGAFHAVRDPHADGFLHDDSCPTCRVVSKADRVVHLAREMFHDRFGPAMIMGRRAEVRLAKAIEAYEKERSP